MFSTYEFDYVIEHFTNYQIASFSPANKMKNDNNRIIQLSITDGLKAFLFSKKINRIRLIRIATSLLSINIKENLRNLNALLLALSFIKKVNVSKGDYLYGYWMSRSSIIAFILNQLLNIDYIVQGHGSDIYIYPPSNLKHILKGATLIITIGEKNKNYLRDKYEIPEEKLKVFRLGISKDFVSMIEVAYSNRKLLGNSSDEIIKFITVARYEKVKGIDILLKAISLIKNKYGNTLNMKVDIYGSGKEYRKYQRYIRKHKIDRYVALHRWIDRENLAVQLAKSDFYILPSRSEGVPVVLMEACAAGLAIIASDVGGVSEVAISNFNAILIEKENTNELLEAIIQCYRMKSEKKIIMGMNSIHVYKTRYRLEDNLESKYGFINFSYNQHCATKQEAMTNG